MQPIAFEPITNLTLDKIGTASVKIRIFRKSKIEYLVYYIYLVMVKNSPSILVFKGKSYETLESKLNNHPYVSSGKIFIAFQYNAWVDY